MNNLIELKDTPAGKTAWDNILREFSGIGGEPTDVQVHGNTLKIVFPDAIASRTPFALKTKVAVAA